MSHRFLDAFKGFLHYDLGETSKDDTLSLVLSASEKALENLYGIVVATRNTTLVFDGDGKKFVYVATTRPTLVSLTVDGTLIDNNLVYFKLPYFRLKEGTFTSGIQNCTLVYSEGYLDTDVPSDLLIALFKLAEKLFKDVDEARDGISNFNTSTKTGVDFIQKHLPDTFELLIQPYRVINL